MDGRRLREPATVVAVELSIQGTFLGPLEIPAGIVQPTAAKVDGPLSPCPRDIREGITKERDL